MAGTSGETSARQRIRSGRLYIAFLLEEECVRRLTGAEATTPHRGVSTGALQTDKWQIAPARDQSNPKRRASARRTTSAIRPSRKSDPKRRLCWNAKATNQRGQAPAGYQAGGASGLGRR